MNGETRRDLMTLVERAVRPVKASANRKRCMREELLAHASAVFDEEAVRLEDVGAAVKRTSERFGDPAALTVELQRSVPRSDWYARKFDGVLDFRRGESTARRALRLGRAVFVLCVAFAFLSSAIWWPVVVLGKADRGGMGLAVLLLVDLSMPLACTLFTPILTAMRGAIQHSNRGSRSGGVVAALCSIAVVPSIGFLLYWTLARDLQVALALTARTIPVALITPPGMYFLARQTAREIEFKEEWESLDIAG